MNPHLPCGPERRTLTPLAAALTRLARLINDAKLPDASLAVQADGRIVSVNATLCPSPVDVVTAWAAALQLPLETVPGLAFPVVQAVGTYDAMFFIVRAVLPTEIGRTDEVHNDAPVHVAVGGA